MEAPFDWKSEMTTHSLERCTNLTALDLSVGAARVPYSDLPCFTLVSGGRVREQHYWKEMEPHYSLKCTLGLDESRLENLLRLYRLHKSIVDPEVLIFNDQLIQMLWVRDLSDVHYRRNLRIFYLNRPQDHWSELLLTATKNAANYALDCIIASDTNKLDDASLKKLMCGIQVMTNLKDNEVKILTDKLSWILPKLKDGPMRAELGKQLAKILCSEECVIDRALALYDTERLEFCLRNGLSKEDFPVCCSDPFLLLDQSHIRVIRHVLTYLNFGYFLIEELCAVDSRNARISLCKAKLKSLCDGDLKVFLKPKYRRRFWFHVSVSCFLYAYNTPSSEPSQVCSPPDDGYIPVVDTTCTAEEWVSAARYFWRSITSPYITKLEYFHLCDHDVLKEERHYARYCQEVYEEVVHEFPSPRSLQQHCRVAVRQQLLKKDHDLVRLIDQLEVPSCTKVFLKLKI